MIHTFSPKVFARTWLEEEKKREIKYNKNEKSIISKRSCLKLRDLNNFNMQIKERWMKNFIFFKWMKKEELDKKFKYRKKKDYGDTMNGFWF